MKSMPIVIVAVVGVLVWLFFSNFTRMDRNESYKFLFRTDIYSSTNGSKSLDSTYELAAVMRGRAYQTTYLYLIDRQQYLVRSYLEPYEIHRHDPYAAERKGTEHCVVLLDKQGQKIQQLNTELQFSPYSGLFFAPTYYMNWLNEGDTARIAYHAVLNEDLSMTRTQFVAAFREYYAKAEYFEYVNLRSRYNDKHGSGVVFKTNKGWHMLLSPINNSHLFAGYPDEDPKTGVTSYIYKVVFPYGDSAYHLPNPYPQSEPLIKSVYLETNDPYPYRFNKFTNKGQLTLQKYEKQSSTGWQGVAVIKGIPIFVPGTGEGIAYLKLKIDKQVFRFKIPDVEKFDYRPIYNLGVRVFKMPKQLNLNSTRVFVESTQNGGEFKLGGGVYVVRSCSKEKTISSALPNGITEARYKLLPLTLQIALLDIENTTELEIESGEQQEWLPEIELLKNLTYLKIRTHLTVLPDGIARLNKLKVLILEYNNIQTISPKIAALSNLKILKLYSNHFDIFPTSICELKQLSYLSIGGNNITELPCGIGNMQKLEELQLLMLNITNLPNEMIDMNNLRIIRADEIKENVPEQFHHLFQEVDE